MTDFVVYHKPEVMGYNALDVDKLAIYTNKVPAGAEGGRVWLLTGEGSPRTFKLRATFIVDAVKPADRPEFKTLVSGKDGRLFHPMPVLSRLAWFDAFKKSQGNFAFGFQPISDPAAVAGLHKFLP